MIVSFVVDLVKNIYIANATNYRCTYYKNNLFSVSI